MLKFRLVNVMLLCLLVAAQGQSSDNDPAVVIDENPTSGSSAGGTQPPTDDNIEPPGNTEGAPGNTEGAPSNAEGAPSNAEGVPSNAEGVPSNAEGTLSNEGAPSNAEGAPSNVESPPSNVVGALSSEGAPSNAEGAPSNVEGAPSNVEGALSNEGAPSNAEGAPSNVEGAPSNVEGALSNEGAQSNVEGAPSNVEGALSNEGAPSNVEGAPSNVEGTPSNIEGALSNDGAPSNAEGPLNNAESVPSNAEGAPSNAEGASSNVDGALSNEGSPSNAEGSPNNAEGAPSNTEGPPSDTEGAPSNTEGEPSNAEGAPSNAEGEPSNAEGALSNVDGSRDNVQAGPNIMVPDGTQASSNNTDTGNSRNNTDTFTEPSLDIEQLPQNETHEATEPFANNTQIPPVLSNPNDTNITQPIQTNTSHPAEFHGTDHSNQGPQGTTEIECSFPADLEGGWKSTIWGAVNITDTVLYTNFDIGGQDIRNMTCYKALSNGDFILRTGQFTDDGDYSYYSCMNFLRRNKDNFHVILKTPRNESEKMEPLQRFEAGVELESPWDRYCSNDNTIKGDLVREGRVPEGSLGCPESLDGMFNVTYIGATLFSCPDGDMMTSCAKSKTLTFDHTTCHENATEEYPDSNDYICVSGGIDQVTLFRDSTEVNEFTPFSCMTLTKEPGNITKITHGGNGCGGTWMKPSDVILTVPFIVHKIASCVPEPTHPDVHESGNPASHLNGTDNGPGDAAPPQVSSGMALTFVASLIAMFLTKNARFDQ